MKKQTWTLTNKDNGRSIKFTKLDKLNIECLKLLNLNRDEDYLITYFENGKEIEQVKMSDYF